MRSFRTTPLASQPSRRLRRLEPSWTAQRRRAHTDPLKPAPDHKVFRNSLEKTLEAHRSANRASLIRRVWGKLSSLGTRHEPSAPTTSTSSTDVQKTQDDSQTAPLTPDTPLEVPRTLSRKAMKNQRGRERKRAATLAEETQTADAAMEVHTTDEINVLPEFRWNASGDERPVQLPWLQNLPSGPRQKDPAAYLNREIQALDTYFTPSPRETEAVKLVVSQLSRHLKRIAPNGLGLFGSRRTGMAVSHSDLNLDLLPGPSNPPADGTRAIQVSAAQKKDSLEMTKEILSRFRFYGDFAWTGPPSEPLLEFNHDPTGLHVQLRCSGATLPYDAYIEQQQILHPHLRPLYKTVRLLLETQGFFGAHRSSVTPRALQLLVLAYLKLAPDSYRNPKSVKQSKGSSSASEPPKDSLGLNLLAFLDTYGHKIDLQIAGISISPPGFFNPRTIRETVAQYESMFHTSLIPPYIHGQLVLMSQRQEALERRFNPRGRSLCIQCPLNPTEDVGYICQRPVELGVVLARAHDELQKAIEEAGVHLQQQQQPFQTFPGGIATRMTILGSVLRANFEDFIKYRKKIVQYAESVKSTFTDEAA